MRKNEYFQKVIMIVITTTLKCTRDTICKSVTRRIKK